MEANEYLRVLQRRWPIVVVAVVLGLGLGYLTADPDAEPERFSATHTIGVDLSGLSEDDESGIGLSPSQVAVFTTVGAVPAAVAESIDFDGSPQQLAAQVDAQADDELGIVEITATDSNEARAVEIADGFAAAVAAELRSEAQQQLEADLELANGRVLELGGRIEQLDAALALFPPNGAVLTAQRDALVNQYSAAYNQSQALQSQLAVGQGTGLISLEAATARPVAEGLSLPDDTAARMIVLGFFGLLLGLAAALVTDRLDTRIRSRADVSAATSLPVLAEIPVLPRRNRHTVVTAVEPASPFAEAYRNLRTVIDFMALAGPSTADDSTADDESRRGPQVILVTSPGPGEGKTTTVAHLAASYAETNQSVLVLDCDFRRPRQHRIFDVEDRPGFSDALIDPGAFNDAQVIRDTEVRGLRLVPAGTPTDNPAHLFKLSRRLIDAARQQADVVLIDTPPLLAANDAAELMDAADTTLVAVRANETRRDSVERVSEQLERLDVPVAGVVLIATQEAAAPYGGQYSYSTSRADSPHGWHRLLFWRDDGGDDRIHDEDIPAPTAAAGEDDGGHEDAAASLDVVADEVGGGDETPAPVEKTTGPAPMDGRDHPAGDVQGVLDNGADAPPGVTDRDDTDRDDVSASSP